MGQQRLSKNKFTLLMLGVLLILILVVWMLFNALISNYRKNTVSESADHLVELSYQISLYVREKIDSDWQITHSVANAVESGTYTEKELTRLLAQERELWGVNDLILYLENGRSISVSGSVSANDIASDTIYHARRNGEYMSVVDSAITYTVPIDSDMTYEGSRVVAASVVQEMATFLDNMRFSSFGGSAFCYLTQENGVVISKTTHKDAPDAYNILALLEGEEFFSVRDGEHTVADMLSSESSTVDLMRREKDDLFVVTMPVLANRAGFILFYVVSEAVVNRTMASFSTHMTALSVTAIAMFIFVAVMAFRVFYRAKKQKFDRTLFTREHMFDLLVENTSTSFGLFDADKDAPLYISSNNKEITGEECFAITRENGAFRFVPASGRDGETLRQMNEEIADWDGQSPFVSGYVPWDAPDGTRYFSLRIYPGTGGTREMVGIAQDVTADRAREETLRTALDMADRASNAKTRFLSNMSHDIRTPMNAIVNMTNFAIGAMGDPKTQAGYLDTIRESSAHLLQLINDVLDMSRIESGQTTIAREPFRLSECLRGVCEIVRPLAEARDQRFVADIDRISTGALLGDQLKLRQVLINLLNNAVKFTPMGGRLSLTAKEMPSLRQDVVSVRFTVADNGIGIAPDKIEHVFEPFVRGDEKRITGTEGTGLGLSICRSYINAMGGTVRCESELGKGSVFTVEMPFGRGAQTAPPPEAIKPTEEGVRFDGRRALVCEDNPINQTIAVRILKKLGFEVETASDGGEGAHKFEMSRKGYYDVIYMDIQMPVMDGYQTTRAIRESLHPDAATVPIIAMTANVFAEDVERSRSSGMDGHIGKPISVKDVMEVTAKALYHGGTHT